ncbi:MAG: tetrathionate reductase family octaheme c-type cytochrome [Candidatus Krumholzibacteriia bacterium]
MTVRITIIVATLCLLLAPLAPAMTDHSEFDELKVAFQSGPEVTRACLGCHEAEAREVHATMHWTWRQPGDETGLVGKAAHTVNNFCINVNSNWPRCTSCHVGYGFKDASFDFTAEDKVDCLVCHEHAGTYKKFPSGAGNPVTEPTMFSGKLFNPPDYAEVAQSVGAPGLKNCGVCHFYGGGGDAVKHGDLDSTLLTASRDLDVHMSKDGAGLTCQACHTTVDHQMAGRQYTLPASHKDDMFARAGVESQMACDACHTAAPHEKSLLNKHTARVSCQACHIPIYARGQSTKVWWDWSQAGKLDQAGKPIVVQGADGKPTYDGKKGAFRWEKNLTPEFAWYDGTMSYVAIEDKVDPSAVVWLQKPNGGQGDPASKLYPFKIHRGKTPYDKGLNNMVVPKLLGKPGSGAYWGDFDWDQAIRLGMASVDVPYSGEYGFVETAYAYPVTHQVAPKEFTTDCTACHVAKGKKELKPGLGAL